MEAELFYDDMRRAETENRALMINYVKMIIDSSEERERETMNIR